MNAHQPLSEAGQAALSLALMGRPVFPCDHRADLPGQKHCKRPLTRNGFKDAITDPIQVEPWWLQNPDALIAVPTGPRIRTWVLDQDLDHEEGHNGPADQARREAEHGPLPVTMKSITPRGGRRGSRLPR